MSSLSTVTTASDGVTASFSVPFPYISQADVSVLVDGEAYGGVVTWTSPSLISLNPIPAAGVQVTRQRLTPVAAALRTFAGGALASPDLNKNQQQALFALQEAQDGLARSFQVPLGETAGDLPAQAQRAGSYLAFDAEGKPVASAGTGADAALRADVAAPTGSSLVGFQLAPSFPISTLQSRARYVDALGIDYALATGFTDQSGTVITMWQNGGAQVNAPGLPSGLAPTNTSVVSINTPLDNLYGSGIFVRAGGYVQLPSQKVPYDMARKVLALFQEAKANIGGLCLAGTSIDAGYNYAIQYGPELDWFTNLRNLVAFVTKQYGEETTTDFSDPVRYKLTLSGGAVGTHGPVGRSLVLQVGEFVEWTGAYSFNEIFFQRATGAGKLAFTYNGGAAYKTIDCAGSAADDICSFQSAQASGASGVHRMTCTTNPVEVTGLIRTNGGVTKAPTFSRASVASTSTTNLMGHIPSLLTLLAGYGAGKKSVLFLDHQVNDWQTGSQSNSVATFRANVETIIKAVLTAGHYIVLMTGMRPDEATFAHVADWDLYSAALRGLSEQYDVPLIDMDVWDWFGKGFLNDGIAPGLHPGKAGALARNQIVFDQLSKFTKLHSNLYLPQRTLTFANLPALNTTSDKGQQYFVTDKGSAGKPVWWSGASWVDGAGTVVT